MDTGKKTSDGIRRRTSDSRRVQTAKKLSSGKKRNSKKRRYIRKFLTGFLKTFLLLGLICCIAGAGVGFVIVKKVIAQAPEVNMENLVPQGYATTIYDNAGNPTETLVTEGSNRESAVYEELPKDLINAFVAYEDSRFWKHKGIDMRSILRAVKGVLTHDSSAGGGSTITQQLIKNNVFAGGMEKTFKDRLERKIQEQYLALKVEKYMSKEQIITNYLNTINLGNNTLGVKVASKRYFNKEVKDLELSECAVLAGISQNPSKYNPISGQAENAKKRKVILQYMEEQGYITKPQMEEALADDVYSRIQSVDIAEKETSAPYSYFTDELIEQVKETLTKELGYTDEQAHKLLYSGGLSIYTTQDPVIQAVVDEEVNNPDNYNVVKYSMEYRLSITHGDGATRHYSQEHIKSWHKNELNDKNYDGLYESEEQIEADVAAYKETLLKGGDTIIGESLHKILQPQVSFIIMDQKTGQVKAVNGGRGKKTASLTLNRGTNTLRQPGSTFKVITSFAPALEAGETLGSVYYDDTYTVGNKTFNNWYKKQGFMGYHNIREGIVYSMNIVAVRCLLETVTPSLGYEYAKKFGITTLKDTDKNPALALGGITDGVTNLELTGAFASIANQGVYEKPVFFTKILDHDGSVLYESVPDAHKVLDEATAFLLTDAMEGVVKSSKMYSRPGPAVNTTNTRAAIPGMTVAGKSGTTTSNKDLWFVGYTPYYTAGIWSGYDNNHVITGGTSYHKVIWQKIMSRIHEGMSDPGFKIPGNIQKVEICRKSGKLAIPGVCDADPRGSAVYSEYFVKGTAPTENCDKHVKVEICTESGQQATPFCPSITSGVFMVVPPNSGETDDSVFALPGYCTIHDGTSTIIWPESSGDGDEGAENIGPGEGLNYKERDESGKNRDKNPGKKPSKSGPGDIPETYSGFPLSPVEGPGY